MLQGGGDQFEFQVKQAGDYVEEANVDVHQAIEYQKSIRKKQWYVWWSTFFWGLFNSRIVEYGLAQPSPISIYVCFAPSCLFSPCFFSMTAGSLLL
jgi:hypothetical protein